jgi:hypothetical protein
MIVNASYHFPLATCTPAKQVSFFLYPCQTENPIHLMPATSLFSLSLLICFLQSFLGALRRWYNPPWFSEVVPSTPYDPLVLREAFEKACALSLTLCFTFFYL